MGALSTLPLSRRRAPLASLQSLLGTMLLWAAVASGRRLSAQDFKTFQGTLPAGGRQRPARHMTLVHIPKTAGSSFLEDSPGFMLRGDSLVGNLEKSWCYTRAVQKKAAEAMIVIVRSPHAQIVSQFLECKYDGWGKRVTRGTKFPRGTAGDVFSGLDAWLNSVWGA